MSENKAKKLAFVCKKTIGHITLSVAIAKTMQKLYGKKYEFYFVINADFEQVIRKRIDDVYVETYSTSLTDTSVEWTKRVADTFAEFGEYWKERDLVKFNINGGLPYWGFLKEIRDSYPHVTRILKKIKPDLIFIDDMLTSPMGTNLNIKYVNLLSANPTLFGDKSLPPPGSALPGEPTEENKKLWNDFIQKAIRHEDYLKFMKETNDWLEEEKSKVRIDDRTVAYASSPFLNIYNFPRELDYAQMEGNWVLMDSAVTDIPKPFNIPKKLEGLSGELIYFSLGSMSACYKPLMNRLLKIFSEISHRFIISLGPIGQEYDLYDNQYGENYIDQLAVLQTVRLFISHGGNNSITEAIHLGVPTIVLPLFGDQYANAIRIDEKKCGKWLDPFLSTKEEFKSAIEFCLSKDVKNKSEMMSNRIKKDNNLRTVCDTIVKLIE